jgi:thiamine transport system substrate-binding protein
MKRICFAGLAFLMVFLAACTPRGPATLTVMTHDSFAVSQPVVDAFEQANDVKLVFLKSGDAGAMLNKAILTKAAPLADVLFGVDNTFLSRALAADLFIPYWSPLLDQIPSQFQLDPGHRLMPVDYADVCINYDKAYFSSHTLAVPQSLEDLTQPEYRNLLVVENPATSSTGLAFLLATVAHFGDPGYLDYWRQLRTNGLAVVDSWSTAYYTNFSGSSGHGAQPLVLSYASSPAAEVIYADPPVSQAPTASLLAPGTCFRQVEFVGILKGTRQQALAEKFVDAMLGLDFQQDMPLQMFVYPVNPAAVLPQEFVQWAQNPSQPAEMSPEAITAGRDGWIQAWTEAVLH